MKTFRQLDDRYWPPALKLYHEAFPRAGRKPDAILAGMFAKGIAYLHAETDGPDVFAMAITGLAAGGRLLLIDYIAVDAARRGSGIGSRFLRKIADWARDELRADGIVIEAEAEPTAENAERILFWEKNGFALTPYVHRYIWVPEPYQAMYLSFAPVPAFPTDGETLFTHISGYHAQAFRRP